MDWLQGMNKVADYIEENLSNEIRYESLARIVGCSAYEFARIFSFVTGCSVAEYIRKRRLSQAVYDIQGGKDKIIDIALKYGYESPTTFSRAFKEFHGVTPSQARERSVPLKNYPPITFILTIKGGSVMDFRMESKESFQIVGLSGYEAPECVGEDSLTPLWREFMDKYNARLWNGGSEACLYTAPFWQVASYDFEVENGKLKATIGAEYKGIDVEGMDIRVIPAATWAVFSFASATGADYVSKAYHRILTEWFPKSCYRRDESVPHLEVFPAGDVGDKNYTWEIWMPVLEK